MQFAYCMDQLGLPEEKVNPNGGEQLAGLHSRSFPAGFHSRWALLVARQREQAQEALLAAGNPPPGKHAWAAT